MPAVHGAKGGMSGVLVKNVRKRRGSAARQGASRMVLPASRNWRGFERLVARMCRLWAPPPRLQVSEWADRYAYLPRQGNAEPGKYRLKRIPYQAAMLDDGCDGTIIEFVWIIASQLGKTLCIILMVEYYMHQDPSAILVVYPTIDSAKAWSKEKLTPTMRETPVLRGLVKKARSRDSGNTILHKMFPGGDLTVSGANSPSSLRQRSKRIVILDEIDAMEPNAEGDPVEQADKRAETFHNAIKGKSSTPTIKGVSKIGNLHAASDKQKFFVPCWKCGQMQTLKWAQFKFQFEQPDGTRNLDTAHAVYVCENEACKVWWTDAQRIEAITDPRAEWRATAPFAGIRGRHLNGLYQILGKKKAFASYHHQFAENFLRTKRKGRFALMVWTNTFLAEEWEEATERIEATELEKRRESYGRPLPDKILVLTAAVDVHDQWLEVDVVGWGEAEESWAVEHRVFPGDPKQDHVWRDLDPYLLSSLWKTASGRELRILATCVDSGHLSDYVYRYCKPRFARRIFAVKGSNQRGEPIVGRLSRAGRRKCPVYRIGTDTAKSIIYDRLRLQAPGPGYMHFPSGPEFRYDADYFAQLTAEEISVEWYKGVARRVWKLPEGRRNEALDLRVYNQAALIILQPNWEALARNIKEYELRTEPPRRGESDDEAQTENPQIPPKPSRPRPLRRPGGWIKGWRR